MSITEMFKVTIGDYLVNMRHWDRTVYRQSYCNEHYARYNHSLVYDKYTEAFVTFLFDDKNYTRIEVGVTLKKEEEGAKGCWFYFHLKENIIKFINKNKNEFVAVDVENDFYLPLGKAISDKIAVIEERYPTLITTAPITVPVITKKQPTTTYSIDI